jgi:hypothetical protein
VTAMDDAELRRQIVGIWALMSVVVFVLAQC